MNTLEHEYTRELEITNSTLREFALLCHKSAEQHSKMNEELKSQNFELRLEILKLKGELNKK